LSDPSILICGPALDAAESADRLEMLRIVPWPNAKKYVVTTGKFDAGKLAKSININAQYPPEPVYLQTLAGWVGFPDRSGPRFRDGYDLFCLRKILTKDGGFDYAILLREAIGFQDHWQNLRASVEDRIFLTFHDGLSDASDLSASCNVLFDLRDRRALRTLDLAWELYLTGAVYALTSYNLNHALTLAVDALRLEDDFDRR
jgi:hypothetical protein